MPNTYSGGGVGGAVGRFLQFDPTPRFNISNPLANKSKSGASPGPQTINVGKFDTLSPIETGNAGGSGQSAQDVAQLNQARANTQAAIDRLGSQFESGASGIDAQYTNAFNQLLGAKNQANQAYSTNKQQTATDYVGAKNTIGTNAGQSLNGLLRLLGARGAGGGSAARIAAPEATAREATIQRSGAAGTFGKNNQALDTNWSNYVTGYDNQVAGIGNQRDAQKGELQRTIDTNRASLLQTLAQLSAAQGGSGQDYLNQANAALDRTANYRVAPINYQTAAYQAPELGNYTVNPNATPSFEGQQPTNDFFSPYLSALLGRKEQNPLAALTG